MWISKMKINIPSDLTKNEIADLIEKLSKQSKMAPDDSNEIYIWAVLDRSGSMGSVAKDSIGGFNTFLQQQKDSKDGKAFMSVHLFDDKHSVYPMKPVEEVLPLDSSTYVPRGSTALHDAIGQTINRAKALNKKNNIIVILTDGEENASREFKLHDIKKLIKEAEDNSWQFIYLGDNQDSFKATHDLGMARGLVANYVGSAAGTSDAYATASNYTLKSRSDFLKNSH